MMLSVLILSCSVLVTHAPGWSHPIKTVDMWSYGAFYKSIEVTETDHIHQIRDMLNNQVRVGYKVFLPDGTVLFPEEMISHDVWSSYPTSTLVNGDSVVAMWREGAPEYYCVREHDGEEAVPTSLFVPDPWVHWPYVSASSDSLGRIHAVFGMSAGICYGVFEPGIGELWRDTLPSGKYTHQILVDGNRIHIVFEGPDQMPDYIQYDLEGNVTVPVVSLIDDLTWFNRYFRIALDFNGDLYCLFDLSSGHRHISLFKIDGETGNIIIYDKLIWDGDGNEQDQTILPTASGDSFYLLWRESRYGVPYHTHYIMFSLIDMNGDFIEEPYEAYDYSDEGLQNLYILRATTNDEGDIFAIWDQGDVGVGGYWIVMGWFDHNWVGIEEETTTLLEPCEFVLIPSLNPFSGSVTITVESDPLPGQLVVYDLSGHMVSTLYGFGSDSFFWDGCDSEGNDLPAGTYIVQGASSGRTASIKVIKL